MTDHHRIVRLEAENVKRLTAIELSPTGDIVEITGQNGQGKSSLLDSIYWALSGKDVIQKQPIRAGQTKAKVQLDIGGYIVTRKMTKQDDGSFSTTLTVESDTGMTAQKPQQFLNGIVGELTSDPLAFVRMKPAEQFEQLKQFVPNFDFAAAAKARKDVFDKRTEINRRAKDFTAQAAGVAVPEGEPPAPVDEGALVASLEAAGVHNSEIARRHANRERVQQDIERNRKEVIDCMNSIARDRQRIKELHAAIETTEEQIAMLDQDSEALLDRLKNAGPLPEPIDTSEIRTQISAAREQNRAVTFYSSQANHKRKMEEEAARWKAHAEELTAQLEEMDAARAKAISGAKMPVEGIGFGDGFVTFNGVPFDQASSAEQLRASVGLAMAANPKVRVLLLRDGSLLDKNSMKILAEMAAENDFQVWVETVGHEDKPGVIVIEDGAVKS